MQAGVVGVVGTTAVGTTYLNTYIVLYIHTACTGEFVSAVRSRSRWIHSSCVRYIASKAETVVGSNHIASHSNPLAPLNMYERYERRGLSQRCYPSTETC